MGCTQELRLKPRTKGNMRPLFTILKEIQASFDKHKLGNVQKGNTLNHFW